MRFLTLVGLIAPLTAVLAADLGIENTLKHKCERPTKKGDSVSMHYIGTLQSDGSEFDQSYKRGQPLTFKVGQGQVIKGWDQGLLDMCPGDKRTLTIPPSLGYGDRGVGPIPGGATLIFQTELVSIAGVDPEEKVVVDKASEPEPSVEDTPEADETASTEASETAKAEL